MGEHTSSGIEGNGPQRHAALHTNSAVRHASRRRFVAGLASAPIVTLMAPPAMAQVCSFSGMQSATHQSHSPETCTTGLSPGYWMENYDNWPAGYDAGTPPPHHPQGLSPFSDGTAFMTAFGSEPRSFGDNPLDPISLMNAMRDHTGSPEFHWVAALLNAASIPGYPYSVQDICKLWQDPSLAGAGVTYVTLAEFFHIYLES